MASAAGAATGQLKVVLFYNYSRIDADATADHQRTLCASLGLQGRVLVAKEGINGTLAGDEAAIDTYVKALKTGVRPADVPALASGPAEFAWGTALAETDIKGSWAADHPFPDLKVAVVSEVVSTAGIIPDDFTNAGVHLTPQEFHEALLREKPTTLDKISAPADGEGEAKGTSEAGAVLLDVRNACEYAIGHFDSATEVPTRCFSEYPRWIDQNVEKLKGKKVFM